MIWSHQIWSHRDLDVHTVWIRIRMDVSCHSFFSFVLFWILTEISFHTHSDVQWSLMHSEVSSMGNGLS